MLLSGKNDESDGNKTFEVYSSYITVATNKTLIDIGSVFWFTSEKKCDFLKLGYLFSNFVRARSTRHF